MNCLVSNPFPALDPVRPLVKQRNSAAELSTLLQQVQQQPAPYSDLPFISLVQTLKLTSETIWTWLQPFKLVFVQTLMWMNTDIVTVCCVMWKLALVNKIEIGIKESVFISAKLSREADHTISWCHGSCLILWIYCFSINSDIIERQTWSPTFLAQCTHDNVLCSSCQMATSDWPLHYRYPSSPSGSCLL